MASISVMIKPASGACNMKCKYCFYHDVVSKRDEGIFKFMDKSTCDNLIEKAVAYANGDNIYFVFQGGEPLLAGIDYFNYFVNRVNACGASENVSYSLQTNGTFLDDVWADFFVQNNFLVGVSLDGDKISNKFRIMQDGNDSFDEILKGIDILKNKKVDFNIISVVTSYSSRYIKEIYNYFKTQNFKYLQFIPCLRPFGECVDSELFMSNEEYEKYLFELFILYAKDFASGHYVSIRQFDNMLRLRAGYGVEQCGMNGYCSRQFVVESNGNIYPCDFYCTDEWLLGNINNVDFREVSRSGKAISFIKESLFIKDKCLNCKYIRVCQGGGCKREKAAYDYCEAYKKFYEKVYPILGKMAESLINET